MMRTFLTILLLLGLVGRSSGAAESATTEPELLTGAGGEAWRALLTQLGSQDNVFSTFTERRWFSIRKEPVVIEGEMRMSRALGLSLHYAEKGGRTMIVDEKGILLRDDRGR